MLHKCSYCGEDEVAKLFTSNRKNGLVIYNICNTCRSKKITKTRIKGKGWHECLKKCTKERARKIGLANKGNKAFEYSRKKMSISQHRRFDSADKTARWYQQIGKNETKILDKIELETNTIISRQFPVSVKSDGKRKTTTYRLDGYDKENNIAYEIDDKRHFTVGNVEIAWYTKRRNKIVDVLGCKWIQIKT